MYWQKNHDSEEELERKLMKNHAAKIEGNRQKNKQMVSFFQAMKDPNKNSEQEARMSEVLRGGKGSIKRHYPVDETLYGTKEGLAKREDAQEDQERGKKDRKKRKGKKKKSKENQVEAKNVQAKNESKISAEQTSLLTKNTVSAAAGVGGLALAAMVLLGGKKGQ